MATMQERGAHEQQGAGRPNPERQDREQMQRKQESGGQQSTSTSEMSDMQRRAGSAVRNMERAVTSSPFSLMRRFSQDMDRMFGDFFGPSLRRWAQWPELSAWRSAGGLATLWPEIEIHQSGDRLIIQADVPGMRKEDVQVEVRDRELCISGERRNESVEKEGRYYRSERSYGHFSRSIPLPEGANADTIEATFDNGVLRLEMEAPSNGQGQGRRIEVRDASSQQELPSTH